MKRNTELIICPESTYIGLWDGYLRAHETWIYTNLDNSDAHSLHFHLTQGFVSPQSVYSSPGLLICRRKYDPLIYSRDILFFV